MPSVDRVGRYFPLTIASPLAAADDCCQTLTAAATWLAQAETVARFGLQLDCTLAQFVAQVLALPPCPALPQSPLARREMSSCWHAAGVTLSYPKLPPPAQFERLLRGG
ncbi:hypothetical protein CKO12_12950 [Chromatium okenii]|uniref:TagF domain-containing protein n=1 Tax=Chromatium okenii TaxID=61644 RepID=UPI001908CC36|nr:TagF domain-containing protein [Chromatium okenii]MBK1642760.1 hypothetical protein [Chromatium okenii]